jgi:hypothetical protein
MKRNLISRKLPELGKQGHLERNCWLKDENKHKSPQEYRVPKESANFALDHWNNNVTYLLCGLTIPEDNTILLDPNIWITDMAASVHMMIHKEGL